MSDVEIVHYLKQLIARAATLDAVGDSKVICTDTTCTTIYNPSIELKWSPEGYLTEVKITGKDKNGNTRTFKKTLTWSLEGYLTQVSGWIEI